MYAANTIYAGMLVGSVHITESVDKLPQQLVIPNDQIQLLDSIGQGDVCVLATTNIIFYNAVISMVSVSCHCKEFISVTSEAER